jgi:hypothetical protein
MTAKDFGTKYVCFKCGAKFYDLKKPDPICPKCGANQKEGSAKPEPRRSRLAAAPKVTEPIPVPEGDEPPAGEDDEDSDDVDEEVEDDDM